jgi:di-heme oxidoreductase (putative peroxidase)
MTGNRRFARFGALFTVLAFSLPASAQLTDFSQTQPIQPDGTMLPWVPGSTIGKSLVNQVGAGRGDVDTPASSEYLIARDPFRAVRRGRQLFQRKFTLEQGQGPRVNFDSGGDIMTNPALGAGLSDSCASCHGRPRGAAGFGGDVATRPDSRNSPHLFGIGLREIVADEMTSDLRTLRSLAAQQAATSGADVTLPLASKFVSFGTITAHADGTFDTSHVDGVNADLRVRPFFADGREYSLRAFAVGAFNDEMGLQSPDPVLCAASDPVHPVRSVSPTGMVFDPALDVVKRPPTCDATEDADHDGVADELDPALLDYTEMYLLNYFKPGTGKTTARTDEGLALMRAIGCTGCHVQNFRIAHDRRIADVETKYDPERGLFNRLYATAIPLYDTIADGNTYPKMVAHRAAYTVENLFTDFKRHDLGAAFHERNYDGTVHTAFMTSPLWGVGSKAPYGHDGRSISLEDVILRHGGEAAASKQTFVALDDDNQRKVLEFLGTLVLFPPDDTASNLNPGHPGTDDMQNPAAHGSIALSALFQIASEGGE